MKGMMVMYEHKWKKWGFVVSAIGLLFMLAERLHPFIVFRQLTPDQHFRAAEGLMLMASLQIMFCKEQFDDERAQAIRLKSLQIAFGAANATILAFALVSSLIADIDKFHGSMLFLFSGVGIILYLLLFHIGLYFDFLWDYKNEGLKNGWVELDINKWSVLFYLVLSIVLLLIVSCL